MGKNEKRGKMKCWEFKKCGRQAGGEKVSEMGACSAYPDNGRFCWVVSGTLCKGKVQGTFAEKVKSCFFCDFFKRVKQEEGSDFLFIDLKDEKSKGNT